MRKGPGLSRFWVRTQFGKSGPRRIRTSTQTRCPNLERFASDVGPDSVPEIWTAWCPESGVLRVQTSRAGDRATYTRPPGPRFAGLRGDMSGPTPLPPHMQNSRSGGTGFVVRKPCPDFLWPTGGNLCGLGLGSPAVPDSGSTAPADRQRIWKGRCMRGACLRTYAPASAWIADTQRPVAPDAPRWASRAIRAVATRPAIFSRILSSTLFWKACRRSLHESRRDHPAMVLRCRLWNSGCRCSSANVQSPVT